jgi:UDP-2-acetamido-3-amino-2,3-dideoxy-glucuronate N-acetyltransferase
LAHFEQIVAFFIMIGESISVTARSFFWRKMSEKKHSSSIVQSDLPPPFVAENAIVEEGVTLGQGVRIWHFCQVRPGAVVGAATQVGSFSYIGRGVKIGARCSIQSRVYIPQGVTIEDDVFLGPACTFTNDRNPVANNPSWEVQKTIVRRGAAIGANATILSPLEIGTNALVGAGSVVVRAVPANAVVVGNPAKKIRSRESINTP